MNYIIIPARLQSTRFPNKLLNLLLDKPIIQWAYESACLSLRANYVYITTADKVLYEATKSFTDMIILHEGEFRNGTERVASTVNELGVLNSDLVVNCQADTFGSSIGSIIDDLILLSGEDYDSVYTPALNNLVPSDYKDENVVKVGIKQPAIFTRHCDPSSSYYGKHAGIYATRKRNFDEYLASDPVKYEESSSLEQLRWSRPVIPVVFNECRGVYDINTPEELKAIESRLEGNSCR